MTVDYGLTGRGAVITGAASGIGRAVAELFAREGARLVLVDIDEDAVTALDSALPAETLALQLDVSDAEAWQQAVGRIREDFGSVSVLVNSAGVVIPEAMLDVSLSTYARQTGVNQDGTFFGMHAVAPLIAESGGGAIVNVASIAAMAGYPDTLVYAATKSAVLSMSRSAAHDLAALGVRVNAVKPGIIDTPMQRREGDPGRVRPPFRAGRPEEVAQAIAFLASDLSSHVTGSELLVDGGVTLGGAL